MALRIKPVPPANSPGTIFLPPCWSAQTCSWRVTKALLSNAYPPLDKGWTAFGKHTRFDLATLFGLESSGGEADIEGLSVSADGRRLWAVGSHSLKRKRPKPSETSVDVALRRLATVVLETNRCFLGRAPLVPVGSYGDLEPVALTETEEPPRRAGLLKIGKNGNALRSAIRKDDQLKPFAYLPSKENGLDIEGVAAVDAGSQDDGASTMLVGLRGPVLRGYAVVLEVRLRSRKGGRRFRLEQVDNGSGRLRKHFLNLNGLGIRHLMVDEDDLLILAGPTLAVSGPCSVFRWMGAARSRPGPDTATVVAGPPDLTRIGNLPVGDGCDHPEAFVPITRGAVSSDSLLVFYDSPCAARLLAGMGVKADVVSLG